ncbi:MAG: trimeric intracellular cation channel family protein [Ruminococcaceae bacterium]|nr:trimeric intracellular cation channel family protein [Oscillospiraceae bacterium]
MGTYFTLFEMIGTVSFAVSGALKGIKYKLDIFGVAVAGMVTAIGGGVIRDLVIGFTPPKMFRDPLCALIALIVSLLSFVLVYCANKAGKKPHSAVGEYVFFLTDTIGLAAFTVIGIEAAITNTETQSVAVLLFVGVITGIGGGVLRDIFLCTVPQVFVKHVYAVASVIGSVVHLIVLKYWDGGAAMLLDFMTIIIIRLLAERFKWNLPHIEPKDL